MRRCFSRRLSVDTRSGRACEGNGRSRRNRAELIRLHLAGIAGEPRFETRFVQPSAPAAQLVRVAGDVRVVCGRELLAPQRRTQNMSVPGLLGLWRKTNG
jgi:hypothetical protein